MSHIAAAKLYERLSTMERVQGKWVFIYGIGRICLTPRCDCARTPENLTARLANE